jgi:DNA-binding transcriptional LysR family regulator
MSELPRSQALRCFITIAREGTVSRAASILHLTQPAVSLQLKALEESIGPQLFNRTPGGFTLTKAGAALLPLAHKAVAAALDFGTAAASQKDTQRRTLRVGTVLDPEFIRLGAFVRSLTRGSSQTEVFLRSGMSDDVVAQVGRGELDVGFYVDPTPEPGWSPAERALDDGKILLAPLVSYLYRVIAPVEWSDRVMGKDWRHLARLPWLATPQRSVHRRMLDDIFRRFGPIPKRVGFTDHEEQMIDFVESGVCLSLARDSVIERVVGSRRRNFVIADKVTLACDLSFACLAARRQDPLIANAFTAIQAVWNAKPDQAPPVRAAE